MAFRDRRATTDHRAARLDVRALVEQGVQHLDIVAAGRPMQRRLGVRPGEPSIDVRACIDQRPDRLGAVREVARPVGHDVQQRAGHTLPLGVVGVAEGSRRKLGMLV